jgi:hypothetical protein
LATVDVVGFVEYVAKLADGEEVPPIYFVLANPTQRSRTPGNRRRTDRSRSIPSHRATDGKPAPLRGGLASPTGQPRCSETTATYTLDIRVDMHWTDEGVDKTTEWDWRILREVIGISYNGSSSA